MTQIPDNIKVLGPHSPATVSGNEDVFVISLQFARVTRAIVINTRNDNCTIIADITPPERSNARGKFNNPAPNVAFRSRKIVPITVVPAI